MLLAHFRLRPFTDLRRHTNITLPHHRDRCVHVHVPKGVVLGGRTGLEKSSCDITRAR
jgi:hypothetical protein